MDRSQGRKKSDFVAKTSVDAGAYVDYFVNGTNYKIAYSDFLAGLGVTGTIVQAGAPTGIAVLDIDGTVNKIRNIESGAGILASVSAQNGVEIKHNFSADSTGAPLLLNVTDATPDIASLVGGTGIQVTSTSNYVTIARTAAPYAQVHIQGNATSTTIAAAGTAVKANGTFTVGIESNFTGDTTGKIVYNGTATTVFAVKATVTFSPDTANNQDLAIYIAKNGTVEAGSKIVRKVDAAQSANCSTFFNVSLAQNDYVELYVSNETSTDNLTVIDAVFGISS
jgi:hypothetical protein